MNANELIAWLRANSSGIYRPFAEAADILEQLLDERKEICRLCESLQDSPVSFLKHMTAWAKRNPPDIDNPINNPVDQRLCRPNDNHIDLRLCKPNDKLLTCHNTVMTYIGPTPSGHKYDHYVQYPNGVIGTRLHNGQTYHRYRLESDEDIVAILTENEAKARQQVSNN